MTGRRVSRLPARCQPPDNANRSDGTVYTQAPTQSAAFAHLRTFSRDHIMSDMPAFTPLELAALAAILKETVEDRIAVDQQLRQASVLSRENTGGGFFTTIAVGPSAENVNRNASLGQNVWMSIGGLDYGLGMILHFKGGRASLLEGYAVGAEDTSATDFERVRFAIANEPGRLATNGS